MTKPNIRMDWTINIGSLGAALIFLIGMVGSWYNLKGEVATNKATSDIKLQQLDAGLAEVKLEVRSATTEIKGDIKDLRSDLRQQDVRRSAIADNRDTAQNNRDTAHARRSEELRNR